jgi:hypothetical protein
MIMYITILVTLLDFITSLKMIDDDLFISIYQNFSFFIMKILIIKDLSIMHSIQVHKFIHVETLILVYFMVIDKT